jgi:hypothetical protein
MACFSLSEGSKARPLTLPVTARFDLLESARSRQPGPLPPRFRQETRLSRPRAPSINRCPLGPACAGHNGTRHRSRGFASCEPASGDPLRFLVNIRQFPACAAPLRLFKRKLHSLRPGTLAPDVRQIGHTACQLLQSLRFLSTTVDMTATPRALPEVALLHCFDAGSVASFDASLAEQSQVQGPTCALQRRRRLPAHEAWELCPDLEQPGHLTSRTHVHGGRRSQAQSLWDIVPTSSPADSARPSAQGLHCPTFREEGRDLRTRGAFPSWAAPKGWLGDSTDCHQPVE